MAGVHGDLKIVLDHKPAVRALIKPMDYQITARQ